GGCLDGIDNGVIAGAAAVIAGQVLADLLAAWPGVQLEKLGSREEHPRRAVPALQRISVLKGALQMHELTGVGEALDRVDLRTVCLNREHEAPAHHLAIEPYRAGTANTLLAADVRAGEAQRF